MRLGSSVGGWSGYIVLLFWGVYFDCELYAFVLVCDYFENRADVCAACSVACFVGGYVEFVY